MFIYWHVVITLSRTNFAFWFWSLIPSHFRHRSTLTSWIQSLYYVQPTAPLSLYSPHNIPTCTVLMYLNTFTSLHSPHNTYVHSLSLYTLLYIHFRTSTWSNPPRKTLVITWYHPSNKPHPTIRRPCPSLRWRPESNPLHIDHEPAPADLQLESL